MSDSENSDKFWVKTILGWIVNNVEPGFDKIDMEARLTGQPYNFSYLKVLNLMDHLIETARTTRNLELSLSQNWRLAHRGDKLNDFIVAFLEVVNSSDVGRPRKSGIN